MEIREELQWFAKQMEGTLKENDHKQHWSQLHQDYLIDQLFKKDWKLWKAIENQSTENIIKKATEVASLAMMIADNAKKEVAKNPNSRR